MELKGKLTEGQLERLKIFAQDPSKEDLVELKRMWGKYLWAKAQKAIDEVWDSKGWNEKTMEEFLQTHMRTPYKQ